MLAKTMMILVAGCVGAGALISGYQDERQILPNSAPFMQRKLDDAREIVSGLAMEDFQKIGKASQDMMLLSHEADWNVFQTPEYLHMSSEFRSSAERLRDNANANNLDGATLAYFEVTLNCVRCHKYVRKNIKLKKQG
jgi:cytochrome c556